MNPMDVEIRDEMIYEKTFIMAQASSSESPMFMADLIRFMLATMLLNILGFQI
jgi:hypothetical protein